MRDTACSPEAPAPAGAPRRPPPAARAAVRYRFERLGFGFRHVRASLWLHGATAADFDSVPDLLRATVGGRRDLAVVLTTGRRDGVDRLRARFPDDVVCAYPGATAASLRRFLARRRPLALALLGSDAVPPRSRPMTSGVGHVSDTGHSLDEGALARLRAASVPVLVAPAAADLRAVLPPERPAPPTGAWQVPTLRDRAGQSAAWRALAPLVARGRIDGWDALRDRLGRPRTILCLGNGPSSEDPRLARLGHDCLVRSNWRWIERGFLARPDLVFVGDPRTLRRVKGCVFGFWNEELERAMLLRHLVLRGPAAMAYVTMERLSPLAARDRWPARPSNGALSIVAAAALAPERLVIAGIDLFRHPAGRYPGVPDARNDYAAAHAVDVELEIIDLALRDYAGELEIVGEPLREALAQRRASAPPAA